MIECFSTKQPTNLQQQPYALWNRVLHTLTVRIGEQSVHPTYRQLRTFLESSTLLSKIADFSSAIDNGLMGGYLDWNVQDVVNNEPMHVSTSKPHTELWVQSQQMMTWLSAWARAEDVTVIHRRPLWLPMQLYKSLPRLNDLIERSVTNLIFINPIAKRRARTTGKAHHSRLCSMLAVRRARDVIARTMGPDVWSSAGLALHTDYKLDRVRAEITRALRTEKAFVKQRLRFGQVVIDNLPGKDRPVGCLYAVNPTRLHGVLRTLVLGKYDALDNQVSLTGFKYERPEVPVRQ